MAAIEFSSQGLGLYFPLCTCLVEQLLAKAWTCSAYCCEVLLKHTMVCAALYRYLSSMAPSILLIQSAVRDCSALGPESPHEARMLSALGPMLSTLCDTIAQPPSSLTDLQQRTQAIKQASEETRKMATSPGMLCNVVLTVVHTAHDPLSAIFWSDPSIN